MKGLTIEPALPVEEPKVKRKFKVAEADRIDVMEDNKVLECNLCPRLCDSRTQIVNGWGPLRPKIAVVHDQPNEKEDLEGRPMIGPAGQAFRMWIEMVGLDPDRDVYYTNAVRCAPEFGKEATPTEIKNCNAHIWAELDYIQPDVIIALGNPACLALLPPEISSEGITKLRGHVFWNEQLQRKIVPMFNPNAVLFDFDKEPLCLTDLRKAIKESRKPKEPPVGLGEYFVMLDIDELEDLVDDMIENSDVLSFDVETANRGTHAYDSALNPRSAEILCVGFTDTAEKGWVVPLWGKNWRDIWGDNWDRVVDILRRLFESDIPKIGQNAKFDEHMLEHVLDIIVANIQYDTMYATALVYENMSRSLESLRGLLTTMPFYDATVAEQTDGKKHMEWAEEEVLWTYQAADVDCTLRVAKEIDKLLELEGDKARWILDHVSMPLAQVFKHMEDRGVLIDMELASHMVEDCDQLIIEAEREVKNHLPAGYAIDFNISSHDQIKKLLWGDLKIPKPDRLTPGGKKCKFCQNAKSPNDQHINHTSSDAEALAEVRELHVIIPPLEEYNQLHTLRKTFLLGDEGKNTGLLHKVQDDGRIHTSFRVDGTETGRVSSSPNLQNIPKDDSGKKNAAARPDIFKFVRKLFIVPEGHVMIEADYSQLELRVLAYISGQDDMIEYFKRPDADIHLWMARLLFPQLDPELDDETWKKKHKPQRDAAKVFNFGISYGMTVYGICNRLGVSEAEADVLLKKYFNRLTKVREYFHKKDRQLNNRARAENVLGRPRHFYGVKTMRDFKGWKRQLGHMRRENYNFDIQSTGSDFLSLACIRMDNDPLLKEWGARLILTVHDSVMLECPKEYAFMAAARVRGIMADVPMELKGWHLPAECKIGSRWTVWTHTMEANGEVTEVEKEAA